MPFNTESTKKQTQHASVSEQQTLSESDTDEESVWPITFIYIYESDVTTRRMHTLIQYVKHGDGA